MNATPAYPETLLKHLGRYKRETLNIQKPGFFRHKGKDVAKEHILPLEMKDRTFLPLVKEKANNLRCCAGRPLKWHRFVHHLNSSQVFAVNLFLPLLETNEGLQILAQITGTKYAACSPTGFEHIPNKEENTNIDFCVTGADKKRVFIEVKLTEADFGKAKNDEEHRTKFETIYAAACRERVLPEAQEWMRFRLNYQFYRNALLADANTRVWFLIPRIHRSLIERTEKCLKTLTPTIRPQVQLKCLDELFTTIENMSRTIPDLAEHYAEFRRKYQPAIAPL